jgi:hypothetical protein
VICDAVSFSAFDSARENQWFRQDIPAPTALGSEAWHEGARLHWQHYWACQPCSYPDRTGDLRSVVTIADFYSVRQWHSTVCTATATGPSGTSTSSS